MKHKHRADKINKEMKRHNFLQIEGLEYEWEKADHGYCVSIRWEPTHDLFIVYSDDPEHCTAGEPVTFKSLKEVFKSPMTHATKHKIK